MELKIDDNALFGIRMIAKKKNTSLENLILLNLNDGFNANFKKKLDKKKKKNVSEKYQL